MQTFILIPARYASTRFPGKALAALKGASGVAKTLLQRAWEAAIATPGAPHVAILTDDARIRDAGEAFGARVIMTPESCRNGTERCQAALATLQPAASDLIVNLQGDAPLTPPDFVTALIDAMADPLAQVATPVFRADGEHLAKLRADRAAGRVGGTTAVARPNGEALYFSKEVVPFTAGAFAPEAPTPVLHHVGLYAYRPAALNAYARQAPNLLEELEGLEQLRFLAHGVPVRLVEVERRGRAFWEVNNPEDVGLVEEALAALGIE